MDAKLVALIEVLVQEQISKIELKSIRGRAGKKGTPGKDFEFIDHKESIENIIQNFISTLDLKLHFSDLTDKERDLLTLHFEDLTFDQLQSLKGRPGKDGKDFNWQDHKTEVYDHIDNYSDDIKQSLLEKLTIHSDELFKTYKHTLTEEEKLELRGPRGHRGQKGKPGSSFKFENEHEKISQILTNYIESIKQQFVLTFDQLTQNQIDSLKLKYSDLTKEELEELRGPRGHRGQKGKTGKEGKSTYQEWLDAGNEGETGDFLNYLKGEMGPRGIPGLPGVMGIRGIQGEKGEDGENAPRIIDVDVEIFSDTFRFRFNFDNGTVLRTKNITLPKGRGGTSQYLNLFDFNLPRYLVGPGGVSAGDLLYASGVDTVSILTDLTLDERIIGIALLDTPESSYVPVGNIDRILPNILSGAVPGTLYYWDGSTYVTTPPSAAQSLVWEVGVAKNAVDMNIRTRYVTRRRA